MIVMRKAWGLTEQQVIEAFEEAARVAERADGPKNFPALSADMVVRLCAIARRAVLLDYEPAGYRYFFHGYQGSVVRYEYGPWNGSNPYASQPIYTRKCEGPRASTPQGRDDDVTFPAQVR